MTAKIASAIAGAFHVLNRRRSRRSSVILPASVTDSRNTIVYSRGSMGPQVCGLADAVSDTEQLRRFRSGFYRCLTGWPDAEAMRDLLAAHRPCDWPLVFAVDASTWARCGAETSPERGFYYSASKHSAGKPIVAGWSYSWINTLPGYLRTMATIMLCRPRNDEDLVKFDASHEHKLAVLLLYVCGSHRRASAATDQEFCREAWKVGGLLFRGSGDPVAGPGERQCRRKTAQGFRCTLGRPGQCRGPPGMANIISAIIAVQSTA